MPSFLRLAFVAAAAILAVPALAPSPAEAVPGSVVARALDEHLAGQPALAEPLHNAADGRTGEAAFDAFLGAAVETLPRRGRLAEAARALRALRETAAPRLRDVRDPVAREALGAVLRAYVDHRYGARILEALRRLISFRTFNAEGVPQPPENPQFHSMRDYLSELARDLGFGFRDFDGHAFEIEVAPSANVARGERVIGVVMHGDTVPEGPDWTHPAFAGEIVDGVLYGRGALDDKGAIPSVLYALRALRDARVATTVRFRVVVGTEEETTWRCMSHYLAVRGAPERSVVLDANFPVVVAEKGYLDVTIAAPVRAFRADTPEDQMFDRSPRDESTLADDYRLVFFRGGEVPNAVAAEAEAHLAFDSLAPADALARVREAAARFAGENAEAALDARLVSGPLVARPYVLLAARGRAAHGSTPDAGHNALADLARFLVWFGVQPSDRGALIAFLAEQVGTEVHGQTLGVANSHPFMGPTTVNWGVTRELADEGELAATLNIRWPIGQTHEQIVARVAGLVAEFNTLHGTRLSVRRGALALEPIYTDPEGGFVRTLSAAFEDSTGLEGTPQSVGGTTYAKALPNAVSFGPEMPGQMAERIHCADEHITLDELRGLGRTYVTGMLYLATGDEGGGGDAE